MVADDPTPFEALMAAVDHAGSQSELARLVGISSTAVWKWVQSSKRVGDRHVLRVEAETGISRHVLRPDLYPREVPHAPGAFVGVDRGTTRVSFQSAAAFQAAAR